MSKWIRLILMGSFAVVVLIGCQGKAPEQESGSETPETPESEAVVEETFDTGDTGELSSVSVDETEGEDEPQGDSQ